jgi:acetoin utilization deacetylase AcuC-like enzyme
MHRCFLLRVVIVLHAADIAQSYRLRASASVRRPWHYAAAPSADGVCAADDFAGAQQRRSALKLLQRIASVSR